MTIDLKWGLPLMLPFVFLGIVRAIWWLTDAPWTQPTDAAFICTSVGFVGGVFLLAIMVSENIKWTVRIGGKEQ